MTIIPRGKRLPWPRVLCTLLMLYPFAASSAADESAKVLIIPVDVCDDAQFGPDARKIAAVDPKTGERVTAKGVWWPREHIENMMAHFSKIGAKVVIWQTFEGGVTYPSKVSRRLLTDLAPGLFEAWKHYDPLRVAVERAHKNSLLLIAEVRPFEFGVWFELPEGAPGAELYKMQ